MPLLAEGLARGVRSRKAGLTMRELEAIRESSRYGQGMAAHHMGVSPQTLKNTLSHAYVYLGVNSLTEALCVLWLNAIWDKEGDVPPDLYRALDAEARLARIRGVLDG